ncbi:hypothetical protein EOM60_00560 [Candidatus Saccharibacteria bacterium]|nr:hypothetical protein [Candidatus Saccharibacteria bacterium]
MAKQDKTTNLRVIGIKASTVGAIQGTLFAVVGLSSAIVFTISEMIHLTDATDSLLRGLTFGMARGAMAIIFVPLVYFAIGALIGLIQGIFLNALVRVSGGLVLKTVTEKDSE